MTDAEWMRCKGRTFNPERDSVGLSWREGGTVGGRHRKGAIQGAEPRSARGNEGRWAVTQLVEELSQCQNCSPHNVVTAIHPTLEACKITMTWQRA